MLIPNLLIGISCMQIEEVKNFLQATKDCFLQQHVVNPTRSNHILHLVFTTEGTTINNSLTRLDHDTTKFKIEAPTLTSMRTKICRNYRCSLYFQK